eukprot:10345164-Ditylum_brightwellii.AAC.1
MGKCKLPAKIDYRSSHKCMPRHAITTMFGMTSSHFNFIWRYFHVQGDSINYKDDPFSTTEDNDSDEEDFVEQTMERVDRDEAYRTRDDES